MCQWSPQGGILSKAEGRAEGPRSARRDYWGRRWRFRTLVFLSFQFALALCFLLLFLFQIPLPLFKLIVHVCHVATFPS